MARKARTLSTNGLSKASEQSQPKPVEKEVSRDEELKALGELRSEQKAELDRDRKDLQARSEEISKKEAALAAREEELKAREKVCDEIEAAHRAAQEANSEDRMVRAISVRTRTGKEFRRCGYTFSGEPVEIPVSKIDPKDLKRLREEPALRIKDTAMLV